MQMIYGKSYSFDLSRVEAAHIDEGKAVLLLQGGHQMAIPLNTFTSDEALLHLFPGYHEALAKAARAAHEQKVAEGAKKKAARKRKATKRAPARKKVAKKATRRKR